jgi:hypothetical protein
VRALRQAGIDPRAIVGKLAHGLGLGADDAPRSPAEVLAGLPASRSWPHAPWRVPAEWAHVTGA